MSRSFLPKMRFLDILVVFRLDVGQKGIRVKPGHNGLNDFQGPVFARSAVRLKF